MKPIAIFRHTPTEGPGYFATFLDAHSIPWELIKVDQGEAVPDSTAPYSGLCLMGGTVSVNNSLPWIEQSCRLIRAAVAADLPVIGHCLGGQLMSKALGGHVTRNAVKEIGWGQATVETNVEAARWFAGTEALAEAARQATVFQWHGETFSIPPGATRILGNEYCTNQMFVLGPHLGMQCHVEMTASMIASWCKGWAQETRGIDPLPISVQTPAQMQEDAERRLPGLQRLAERLYSVWLQGLKNVDG